MKSFKEYLLEATQANAEPPERPKRTKTQTRPDINIGPNLNPDQGHLPAHHQHRPEPGANQEPPRGEPQDPRQRADRNRTHQATSGINQTPAMRDLLNRMRDIEPDPEDVDAPRPDETEDLPVVRVNTENLPTVANNALTAAGMQNPHWHQVANLPGNMARGIRTLGKILFGTFTHTPTDDIYMVGNVMGQGPNTPQEVNSVAHWIRENGDNLGPGDIDFDNVMPGYTAEIHQYSAAGIRWLLVRDQFGTYIYSWPEHESKQHTNAAQIGHHRPRLG